MERNFTVRSQPLLEKISMYKETAFEAMRNSFEFSKKVVEEKGTYRDKVSQAHENEYRIREKTQNQPLVRKNDRQSEPRWQILQYGEACKRGQSKLEDQKNNNCRFG